MTTLSNDQFAYLSEQYKALRTESIERMRQDRQVQRNGVLVITALYSFLLGTDFQAEGREFLFFLPPAIAAFTGLQQRRLKSHGDRIGLFCRAVERTVFAKLDPTLLGWEHYLHERRLGEIRGARKESDDPDGDEAFLKAAKGPRVMSMNFLENFFWVGTFAVSLAFAVQQIAR